MLLNFIKVDFRTKILVDKYLELISVGVKPSEILVLVQNSTLKKQFSDKVLEKISVNAIEKLNIHSFFSIVYNTLIENWCFIENAIPADKHFILPNLVGLEVSQFLLKDILKKVEVKGYNSKKSLLHQIFRRYSLIVQNNLTNDEVRERSKILKESFADDAEIIIKRLLSSTLKSRSLDYLRQTLIFNHVYKHTDYFKNIKYLLVDDADEMTPVCFDFIKYLKPQLKDWIICFDSLGSSRCGYLSADTSIECKLKSVFEEGVINDYKTLSLTLSQGEGTCEDVQLTSQSSPHPNPLLKGEGMRDGVLSDTTPPPNPLPQGAGERAYDVQDLQNTFPQGEIIFSNILENKHERLENFTLTSLSKRAEILDYTIENIQNLFKKNILPKDITIITPLQDDMLHFTLRENLKCNLLFLSGSEKLIDNQLVKASLNILKLMLGLEITEMDLRVILSDYVGIPIKYCHKILEVYKQSGLLPVMKLDFYDDKYQKFYEAFESGKEKVENGKC